MNPELGNSAGNVGNRRGRPFNRKAAHGLAALDSKIDIEYMCAFPRFRVDRAVLFFRFADPNAAIALLAAKANVTASEER